jgi:hypothetical protein
MSRILKSMWDELRIGANVRWALLIVLVFSIFSNILILTSPIYMMQVYDRVLASGQVETLVFVSIIAAAALIVFGMLEAVRGYLLNRLGKFLDLTLRDPLLIQTINQTRAGRPGQRRPVEDFATARNYLGSPALLPFLDAPWVPFFVIVITVIHPWLGVLAVASAVTLFGLALANDYITRQPLRQSAQRQGATNEFAFAAIQNAEVVNAMGMHQGISRRHNAMVAETGELGQRAADIGTAITATSKALRMLVQSAALGLGAYLVIRAELTAGGMIAASIVLGRALAAVPVGPGRLCHGQDLPPGHTGPGAGDLAAAHGGQAVGGRGDLPDARRHRAGAAPGQLRARAGYGNGAGGALGIGQEHAVPAAGGRHRPLARACAAGQCRRAQPQPGRHGRPYRLSAAECGAVRRHGARQYRPAGRGGRRRGGRGRPRRRLPRDDPAAAAWL